MLIYFICRYQALGYWITNPHVRYPMSGKEMLVNGLYLLSQYIYAFIVPPAYSAFHVFHPLRSLFEFRILLTLVILIGSGLIAFYLYKKQIRLFYFVIWVPVTFLPFLYFPALGENLFVERYMFLPSVGVSALLSAGIITLYHWLRRGRRQQVLAVLVMCLIAVWSGLSFARTFYWQDDITLCQKTLNTDPEAYHFYNLLAFAYYRQGDNERAQEFFHSLDQMFPENQKKGEKQRNYICGSQAIAR